MSAGHALPGGASVLGFGGSLDVAGFDLEAIDQLRAALPPTFSVDAVPHSSDAPDPSTTPAYRVVQTTEDRFEIWADDREIAVLPSIATAAVQVAARVELDLAAAATTTTVFHAGVVGWHGRALVMPGRSGAGKTTLTAALVRAGATYYTDDFASIDVGGWIHPHRRMRPGLPDDAADGPEPPPIEPALVIATKFEPGATWTPEARRGAGATLDLVEHAFAVTERPDQALAAARAIAPSVATLRGPRGEAEELAPVLLALVDAVVANPEMLTARY